MDWQRLFSRQTLRYPGSCPQRPHFSTRSSRWLSRRKRAVEGAHWDFAALAWKCSCCFSSESYHAAQTGCGEGFRALVAFAGGVVLLSQHSRAGWWLDAAHTPTRPRWGSRPCSITYSSCNLGYSSQPLCLGLLICKIGIIIISTFRVVWKTP